MEPFVIKSYLYDFYGVLLTEHQRRIYEEINFNDYSAAEVARDEGISRQGVHDMMKRCDRILEEYEDKLHLVERFLQIRQKVQQIEALTDDETDDDRMAEIRSLSRSILEEL